MSSHDDGVVARVDVGLVIRERLRNGTRGKGEKKSTTEASAMLMERTICKAEVGPSDGKLSLGELGGVARERDDELRWLWGDGVGE